MRYGANRLSNARTPPLANRRAADPSDLAFPTQLLPQSDYAAFGSQILQLQFSVMEPETSRHDEGARNNRQLPQR